MTKGKPKLTSINVSGIEVPAKECTGCGVVMSLEEFHAKKNGLGGKNSRCKSCLKKYRDSRKKQKSEYDKRYRVENADRLKEVRRQWWKENKDVQNDKRRERYFANWDEEVEYRREYYRENREKILEQSREYYRNNTEKFQEYRENNAERIKEYRKQYYEDNKEAYAERWKRYYEINRDKILEKDKLRYHSNPELYRSRWRAYYATPKGQISSKRAGHRRRVRENGTLKTLTAAEWRNTLEYFGNECAYCGMSEGLTQDHLVPVSKGGDYTSYNIIPACGPCNYSKRDNDFSEWYSNRTYYCDLREYYIKGFVRHMKREPKSNIA